MYYSPHHQSRLCNEESGFQLRSFPESAESWEESHRHHPSEVRPCGRQGGAHVLAFAFRA